MARILQDVGFVHLHVHSSYSLLEGALKVARPRQARGGRQAAGAGADRHQQPLRRAGILREARRARASSRSPACSSRCVRGAGSDRPRQCRRRRRTSCCWRRARRATATSCGSRAAPISTCRSATRPASPRRRCAAHREGLIALTGGPTGPLDSALRAGAAQDLAQARLERPEARLRRPALRRDPAPRPRGRARWSRRELIALADRNGLPLVATNEPFFAKPSDYEAHDALLAIAEGRARLRREPPPALARARLQDAPADDGAVRRPAGRAAGHASRSRCAAPTGCARASRSCRASASAPEAAALDEGEELRRQAEEGLRAAPRRARARARA